MSPTVAEYISLMPISPVSHIWFDVTEESGFRLMFAKWMKENPLENMDKKIAEMPMPFDRIGLVITLKPEGDRSTWIPYPYLIDRNGSEIAIRSYIVGLTEPAISVVFKENFNYKDSCVLKYHPKYLKALGVDQKDVSSLREDTLRSTEILMSRIFMLCYGIPAQGYKVIGSKLRDHHHNAKRRAKGKRQFFEWTTVEIDTKSRSEEMVSQGGTHASPKPHDRRGHQRRYKNGKVVYIRPTTINRHKIPTEGFIHHDYRVSV
jgi:hypothetical protein